MKMAEMKILGMKLYPERKTDEEYVETIRKVVAGSKRHRIFQAVMTAVYIVIICKLGYVFYEIAKNTGTKGVGVGMLMGISLGFLSTTAASMILGVVNTFAGERASRLLLKYHDELKKQK